MTTRRKIKTQPELKKIIAYAKTGGKKIGFTNGCFDILHLGHVRYLEKAKDKCDVLVVGVNSDTSVKRLKGPSRPVNGEKARLEVLAALECVDFVVLFGEDTPEKLIKKITPDILFKGGDWKTKDIVGGAYVKSCGGQVKIITYVGGYSTTSLIKKARYSTK